MHMRYALSCWHYIYHIYHSPILKRTTLLSFCFVFASLFTSAQNTFKAKLQDSLTHEALVGVVVSIENTTIGAGSDANGNVVLSNIPNGKQRLVFSLMGYTKTIRSFDFPITTTAPLLINLVNAENELEEIIVSTMRTNSRIDDLPTKVEVLGQEEMDEESTLVPGNVSSILGDLSIITIQRTNQINGNDAIRMQGLDSKYTQIMRDGLPLYGGFSGSLGVLSIPPLNLKQVEIIKGSASTLYGGGAIGGLINFISKTPVDTPNATISLNATTLKEANFNAFASVKKGKVGATLFAGANVKQAVDINGDGFTEVPANENYMVNPRLFFYINKQTDLVVGLSSNYNNSTGGDIAAVQHGADTTHPFLQKEKTFRNTADLVFTHQFSEKNNLTFKTAGSSFQRDIDYSGFMFNGTQYSSYTELNDALKIKNHNIIVGLNLISENFMLSNSNAPLFSNYNYYTVGSFVQDDWQAFKKLSFQLGVRYDVHNTFGNFFLPRVSLFYKPTNKFSVRLAVGSGYKTPNLFDIADPSPNLSSLPNTIQSENSYGVNADINYHTVIFEKLSIQINQAFYYSNITHPVVIDTSGAMVTARNGNFVVNSYGTDTYIRFAYEELELYLGYNHTEATQNYDAATYNMPFNPKDKFSATLAYKIEEKWRMGIESSNTANQYIYNNKKVKDIWFMALMVERKFNRVGIVLNCENVLDTRQSQYSPLIEGTTKKPVFMPVWGPVEGRVINLSIRIVI